MIERALSIRQGPNTFSAMLAVQERVPRDDVEWFVSNLEAFPDSGRDLATGDTFQIESMLLKFDCGEGGCWIYEPDFESMPVRWTRDVSRSVMMHRSQSEIARLCGFADIEPVSMLGSLVQGIDVGKGDRELVLERTARQGLDSGWFVGSADPEVSYDEPTSLRCLSVYEAILDNPSISPFLGLPQGAYVETSPSEVAVLFGDRVVYQGLPWQR